MNKLVRILSVILIAFALSSLVVYRLRLSSTLRRSRQHQSTPGLVEETRIIEGEIQTVDPSSRTFTLVSDSEEVMLALALGKPIYVLGGPGGAARAVGRLLGLAEAIANRKTCLVHDDDPAFLRLLPKYDHCFSIAGRAALPLCIDELRQFIANHSVTTAAWPWNGLKPDENRELFKRSIRGLGAKHAVDVVVQALLKLDWKASSEHRVQGQA